MASRSRKEMSARIFNALVAHADHTQVRILHSEKARWLSKLDDHDNDLMAKADVTAMRKFTRHIQAVEIDYLEERYYVLAGLSELEQLPEGLVETPLTPGLFAIAIWETAIKPSSSGLEIKEIIEEEYQGAVDYNGHDFEVISNLFPKLLVLKAALDFEYTNNIYRVVGTLVAQSYDQGPIEISDATLTVITELFQTGSPFVPYEIIVQGLLSISWKGCFLELYRCVEQLFPMPLLLVFSDSIGDRRSISDLSQILEQKLAWRPKEDKALGSLVQDISNDIVEGFVIALSMQLSEDADRKKAVARKLYNIRNSLVHFRQAIPENSNAELDNDSILMWMTKLVQELYQRHGERFHNGILPPEPVQERA